MNMEDQRMFKNLISVLVAATLIATYPLATTSIANEDLESGSRISPLQRGDAAVHQDSALFIDPIKASGSMDLLVMHTNDTHAYADRFPYIATAVKKLRTENDNNILLHAGDVFSGDLYFNAFKGQADLELMNYLKYDAMTFGNHEFDLGSTNEGHLALSKFIKRARFPFVSANVDFSKDELIRDLQLKRVTSSYKNGHIYDGVVLNVNGQQVGVFGLSTEETPSMSSVGKVEFTNYLKRAKESVAAFEKQGINKIIALTHLGFDDSLIWDNDMELAKQVEGIDIIVGGHTHTSLKKPYVSTYYDAPTIIVQANEYGKMLGTLNVKFNHEGEIYAFEGQLINTDHTGGTSLEADKEALDILSPFAKKVEKLTSQSIGVEAVVALDGGRNGENSGFTNVRNKETNLGNLMTDAMLAKAKSINPETSIAFQNGGGIRAGIAKGDITVGDVLKVMPFGNALALVELSGADIRATLEHGVGADVLENGRGLKENGAFLHVAGMKFTYDSKLEKGKRVKTVHIRNGEQYVELDDAKTYVVAANAFMARGGDGFSRFSDAYKAGKVSDPGFVDYESFIEYVKSLGKTIEPVVEGRIVDVTTKTKNM
jgi:5'-nucleotidase/UDP-sugar diphosphatase